MTTLYRPVLIESAEQAEALPLGTVAHDARGGQYIVKVPAANSDVYDPQIPETLHDYWDGVMGSLGVDDLVGWSALVPIEAREETHDYTVTSQGAHLGIRTRLVTPWEEA